MLLHRRLLFVFCCTLYPLAVLIRIFLLIVHNGIGAIWTASAMSEGISLPALLTLMFALGAIGLLMSLGRRTQQEQGSFIPCNTPSPVIAARSMTWRGRPMGVCWPPAQRPHRASVGPAHRVVYTPSPVIAARSGTWRGRPMGVRCGLLLR